MIHVLEIVVKMKDGSEWNDFYHVNSASRERAIEFQKSNLLSRIEKAEWEDFLLV